jgi:hypothetical protein
MAAIEISNPSFNWTVKNSQGSQVPSPWIKILNARAAIMASLGDRRRAEGPTYLSPARKRLVLHQGRLAVGL